MKNSQVFKRYQLPGSEAACAQSQKHGTYKLPVRGCVNRFKALFLAVQKVVVVHERPGKRDALSTFKMLH